MTVRYNIRNEFYYGKEDYFAVLSDSRLERLYEKAAAYRNLWCFPFIGSLRHNVRSLPSRQIVFRLAQYNVESLLRQSGLSYRPEDVDGLFLTLRYDGTQLSCISGSSLRIFTLDHSLDHAWDAMLEKFFHKKEIVVSTRWKWVLISSWLFVLSVLSYRSESVNDQKIPECARQIQCFPAGRFHPLWKTETYKKELLQYE